MTKEEWGYVVWGAVAVAVLIPELLASFGMSFVPSPRADGDEPRGAAAVARPAAEVT